jgi:hypothetical protein
MSTAPDLTDSELAELVDLAYRWKLARWNKHFAEADKLRAELMEWGAWPPEHGWHPVFESKEHRYARLLLRVEETVRH